MNSKQFGYISAALYVAVVALLLYFCRISAHERKPDTDVLYIEMEEIMEPRKQIKSNMKVAPSHDNPSMRDNTRQVSGTDQETRTVNQRALFRMTKDGSDDQVNAGNLRAQEGEQTSAKGDGGGYNAIGNPQMDEGLVGRGIIGTMPKPQFPNVNEGGIVRIRVVVNKEGRVVSARFEPKGSTTQKAELINAALQAARKTRFSEAQAVSQGGVISYKFTLR